MQILQMIAERQRAEPEDADLNVIQNLWQAGCPSGDLRSSERIAIRRAASAIERVGEALVIRLSSCGAVSYHMLPSIKPTTRVRKTPSSFWVEITMTKPDCGRSSQAVLFVEFSRSGVTLGLKLTSGAQVLNKKSIRALRRHNRACTVPAEQWWLEKKVLPGTENDCSVDLNMWLSRQSANNQRDPRHLTISRLFSPTDASMNVLSSGLIEAATLFEHLLVPKAAQK